MEKNGFTEPIFFPASGKPPEGLVVADDAKTVEKVVQILGEDYDIKYSDVRTLKEYQSSLGRFKQYFDAKNSDSMRFLGNPKVNKVFNVISLEFTKTRLREFVKPPKVLMESSWVEHLWPKTGANG